MLILIDVESCIMSKFSSKVIHSIYLKLRFSSIVKKKVVFEATFHTLSCNFFNQQFYDICFSLSAGSIRSHFFAAILLLGSIFFFSQIFMLLLEFGFIMMN